MSKRKKKSFFTPELKKFKEKKINNFSQSSDWVEDAFLSRNDSEDEIGFIVSFKKIRLIIFLILFLILFLIARIVYLQFYQNEYYLELANNNRERVKRIEPKRGIIYDRNHIPLVRNVANFLLYLVPIDLPTDKVARERIIVKISDILGKEFYEKIKKKLEKINLNSFNAYSPIFIKDNIVYEKAMELYIESDSMPGVFLINKTRREYLNKSIKNSEEKILSLSHILGYMGKISEKDLKKYGEEYLLIDYIGKTGIENFFENELKGINGRKHIEVDAIGKERKIINIEKPIDGHNLILSIDIHIQEELEKLINRHLKEEIKERKKISVIISDPNSGAIFALFSWPSFDNNIFSKGVSHEEYQKLINDPFKPLFNRSISGEYPSGSTIKPAMVIAALEDGIITSKTRIRSNGGIRISQWFFPDWLSGGHGLVNASDAIAESVNTFFYYIGGGYDNFSGLGVEKIINYLADFGFGSQSGIDLPGESLGFLPSKKWKEKTKKERWYIGDTYHLSIGQGDLLVTPLQISNLTSLIANKGVLYRPHLVTQIQNSQNDKIIRKIKPIAIRKNFSSKDNIEVASIGMRKAVVSGSAKLLNDLKVDVAGKTGTAQWSSTKENHAWFTGFAPYENAEIVFTILIEEGGEGSSVAVPIAKDFFKWYFDEKAIKN